MAEARRLNNAPIQESIIDFRIDVEEQIEAEAFRVLNDGLSADYMGFEPIVRKGVGVEFGENGVRTTHNESLVGYKTENKDRNFVLQFQRSGVTISKMRPYIDWAEFADEAKMAWNLYRNILPKHKVTRVATRFINRLELPLSDEFRFETYLTSCPRIPEGMGSAMAGFFTRLVVPRPDLNASAIIIQTMEERKEGVLPVIIDIDVYRDRALSSNDEELWVILGGLRDIKNQAFFGSINEPALELCD